MSRVVRPPAAAPRRGRSAKEATRRTVGARTHRLQDQIGIRFRRHEQDDGHRVLGAQTLHRFQRSIEVHAAIDEDDVGRRARAGRSLVAKRDLHRCRS
jgi:hypothetical protein